MARWLVNFGLAAFVFAVLVAVIQSAPQMYDDDLVGASGEHYVDTVDPVVVDDDSTPLIRTRRGSHGHGHHHGPSAHFGNHGSGTHQQQHGWGWPQPVGPVFTYVRTDYHGNFQWGVRHRAGRK